MANSGLVHGERLPNMAIYVINSSFHFPGHFDSNGFPVKGCTLRKGVTMEQKNLFGVPFSQIRDKHLRHRKILEKCGYTVYTMYNCEFLRKISDPKTPEYKFMKNFTRKFLPPFRYVAKRHYTLICFPIYYIKGQEMLYAVIAPQFKLLRKLHRAV